MYSEGDLAYFRALIEGDDVLGWGLWWPTHAARFEQTLPRAEYFRLKFGKVKYAADILKRHGVHFAWSPLGRHQAAWSELDPSVLDERGRPRPELRADWYDGAVGLLQRGDVEEGTRCLLRYIRKLGRKDTFEQVDELEELEFIGEQFIKEGLTEMGVIVLRAVASIETDGCLLHAAIDFAKDKLRELGRYPVLEKTSPLPAAKPKRRGAKNTL